MKIVGNTITETDVAMELCKKVQAEEYVIHVVGSTNFYTHLQFSLLASTWFPRPVGVCLWSAMHVFLVLYEALMLLFLFPTVVVLAILMDAIIVASIIYLVFCLPLMVISFFLVVGIGAALAWLWLVITCQCCTMPGRAPGQGLGQYICSTGGTFLLLPQVPQPVEGGAAPVVEGGAAPAVEGGIVPGGLCAFLMECCRGSLTRKIMSHVILVSYPYRRAQLRDLSHEIVPWYDTIVV